MGKVWKIILIFIICFGAFNVFVLFSNDAKTQQAVYSVIEDSFSKTAYLIKEETILSGIEDEKSKLYVNEGERVAKGQEILALLDNGGDTSAQDELDSINERIKAIERAADTPENAVLLSEEIKKKNNQIIYYNARGDIKTTLELKKEILLLINEKAAASNQDNSAVLAELKTRKTELENIILANKKATVYAPCAGTLFIGLDGLEQTLGFSEINSLTADTLKTQLKNQKEQNGYKIINNHKFYIAFVVDNEQAKELGEKSVRVRFSEISDKLVNAHFVRSEQGDKETLIIYSCTEDIGVLISARETEAEIIKSMYEGFKIPMSAIRNNEGLTGVYVDSLGRREFKQIEIIYKTENYVMAKPAGEKPLAMYDNIIID